MAKNALYHLAERRIAEAKRTGSSKLELVILDLTELPDTLWELTELQELHISGTRLAVLPEALGQLTELRQLFVSDNRLVALPTALRHLTKLQLIVISKNLLTTLPYELGALTKLEWIIADSNRLATIPEELGRLQKLKFLGLSGNQLKALPESLGQLTNLRHLGISNNQLVALPEWLGKLTELLTLHVSNNQLAALPEALRHLKKLETLSLHGNPGLGVPYEVLRPEPKPGNPTKPPREILDYYFATRGQAGQVLGECKLIVVGRGGAGKTTLIKRLSGQLFDQNEPETHGINIQKLAFVGQQGKVTSRVWDFGGQVVLHSMHEFFLTPRSLYLLVLGERDDMLERDAAYWLQLIRSYAGNAPVVVALNKSAGRQRQFDRAALEMNFGPILGWVATECSEPDPGKGHITELRQTLTAALDSPHMDSVRQKFPKKWFAIKEAMEEMSESYLDYSVYEAKCRMLGELRPKEQATLAACLHELGVALNYARDPRLRDTTVLRPDWLINGIYAVLRANDLDRRVLPVALNVPLAPNGVVSVAIMERIYAKAAVWGMLRLQDYPVEKRAFLLRLMYLFHLSYPLDTEDKEHLVPTLLPLEPPPGSEEPEAPARVRLRYEFQVVPAPLLPWFIARTFSLIPNRLHWRRGAFLRYGDAQARVWTTQDERYVFVTVAGVEEDRDQLMVMIRGTMKALFQGYRGLHATEQQEHEGEWVPRKMLERFGLIKPDETSEESSPAGPGGIDWEAEP